jgi:hypothetical protein
MRGDMSHQIRRRFADAHPKMYRASQAYERWRRHYAAQLDEVSDDAERQALRADMIQRLHARFDDEAIATRSSLQGRAVDG